MLTEHRPRGNIASGTPFGAEGVAITLANLITAAAAAVRGTVTNEKVETKVETPVVETPKATPAKGGRKVKSILDLVKAATPEELEMLRTILGATAPVAKAKGTKGQPVAKPVADGDVVCPVSGHPVKEGRVFFGFGNDAKAKSVIKGLLAGDHSDKRVVAENKLTRCASPAVVLRAAIVAVDMDWTGDKPSATIRRAVEALRKEAKDPTFEDLAAAKVRATKRHAAKA